MTARFSSIKERSPSPPFALLADYFGLTLRHHRKTRPCVYLQMDLVLTIPARAYSWLTKSLLSLSVTPVEESRYCRNAVQLNEKIFMCVSREL